MWCRDPFLTYLQKLGYCAIRLPKTDVKPLQMLVKQGKDLTRIGELSTVLVAGSNIEVPSIIENTSTANISGRRTSNLSIGIGLSIMATIISAMGGATLGLDGQYQQAKTITFEFYDVLEDRIDVAQLDQFLSDADVNPFSTYVAELLDADEIYVITSVIKSKKFAVDAQTTDGTTLTIGIPEVQQIVGGNIKVGTQAGARSLITYEGNVPLAFGFQAVKLYYDKGQYSAFDILQTSIGMRGADEERKFLTSDSLFVRI